MVVTDEQLKELVLQAKLVDQKSLGEVLEYAAKGGATLYEALIQKNVTTDDTLGLIIANYLKFPFINLSEVTIPEEIFNIVPERIARKHKVIVFARDKDDVKLAMANPADKMIIELISQKTGQKVIPHYATEKNIQNSLVGYKKDLQKIFDDLIKESSKSTTNIPIELPLVKMVDLLIEAAYEDKASDIHIEPIEKSSLIRFRIDGVLHDILSLPKNLHDRIVTRIKVLSNLRTDEHLSAQDGKLRINLEEENLDIRVSIIPIVGGEKVVLRLLSSRSRELSLSDLGMNERDLALVTSAFSKSYGMVLSTGPTGSGKTTTIYSILKIINTREKNITTIEDPVEYRIMGANQVQVNTKTGLNFANGLRSILRQDPNIIFVGEIRDSETAGIAVNAALTGHLVFSTLHTNDAATAIPRLTDMKVEPFLVASTVNIIVAQRLVRKICDYCRISLTITEDELLKSLSTEIIKKHYIPVGKKKEIRIYKGKGCKICHQTGYSGRIGIYEVLEVTKGIRKLIVEKNDSDIISRTAVQEGMTTMLDDGLQKVAKGITTIEEVLRVAKTEFL
ncbi:type II/IV secretion system protein [Candidatus Woesebacteria bacterium]|nr:type II/IV secretion system protein [Candidatus Woesebacteria bacterium]